MQKPSVKIWNHSPSKCISGSGFPSTVARQYSLSLDQPITSPALIRSRHAGRSTINLSDVMLLARRNEGLESILRAFIDQERDEEA